MAEEQESRSTTTVTWEQPKTDWQKDDKFNFSDYNRIKNNLLVLSEAIEIIKKDIKIENMGADIESYTECWKVSVFNSFERNLATIANEIEKIYEKDYGKSQTFYPNGVFIKYDELNRIESATLDIYKKVTDYKNGLRKVPFVLGRFREVRV